MCQPSGDVYPAQGFYSFFRCILSIMKVLEGKIVKWKRTLGSKTSDLEKER